LICATLLLYIVSADFISGPLYVVGIAPITGGISLNVYDLNVDGPESLIGFATVENLENGASWTDSARMDINRETGIAFFVAVSNRNFDNSGRNVTLFEYQYMRDGNMLAEPEELLRCRFDGDIFMFTELFLSSTGNIFGVLRLNGPPVLLQITDNCTINQLLTLPAPRTRVQLFLKEDLLYFPTDGGLNEINLKTLETTTFQFPPNRRWGMASFIALDQNTGTIFMTNTNGNFGDRRWFTFEQATQKITEVDAHLSTFAQVHVFNLNNNPLIGYLNGRRWLAVDPINGRFDVFNSTSSLNAPERSDWRFHTLNTN